MGLFGNYQNAGPGINPNAPQKKPFFRFWELLWRSMGKLLSLNLLYTLLHSPILLSLILYMETDNALTIPMCVFLLVLQFVLIGPTMAGATRVLRLCVLDRPVFLMDEFKKGFSHNFGASFLIWLIDAIVATSVICGYWLYPQWVAQSGSKLWYVPYVLSIAVAVILLFMNFYLLPMQVSTNVKLGGVFKNAFMLACLSPKACLLTTLCTLLMLGIMVLLILWNSVLMFLVAFFPAAFIGFLVMYINYPIIQKYVINPYYEEKGETNPEQNNDASEERVFTDRGGTEKPISMPKKKTIS